MATATTSAMPVTSWGCDLTGSRSRFTSIARITRIAFAAENRHGGGRLSRSMGSKSSRTEDRYQAMARVRDLPGRARSTPGPADGQPDATAT